jgi:hypothetical protein
MDNQEGELLIGMNFTLANHVSLINISSILDKSVQQGIAPRMTD